MGKIRFVDPSNLPYPRHCSRCGNSKLSCIDFGMDFHDEDLPPRIQRRGAVLICETCFHDAVVSTGQYTLNRDIPEPEPPEIPVEVEMYQELVRRARLIASDLNSMLDDSHLTSMPVGEPNSVDDVEHEPEPEKHTGKNSVSKGNVPESSDKSNEPTDDSFGLAGLLT